MATIAKLTADLDLNSASFRKELDKSKKSTKSFKNEMNKADKQTGTFKRTLRGASQGLSSINGPLNGIAGRLSSMTSLLTTGAVGWGVFGAGVAGAALTMGKSLSVFQDVERQQLKTIALVKATDSAAGRTALQLEAQAQAVALNTLASTSGIREAQQVLLTFRAVQKDTFDRAIVLSQDLAAVMGGTAKSAALQLGKALESPTTGMTALRRSGVSFSESEKEVIKNLEETGRIAEAQGLILDKLSDQVGGAGGAEAGGIAGSADTLAQRWEVMLDTIGGTSIFANTAKSGLDILSAWLKKITNAINPSDLEKLNELQSKLVKIQESRGSIEAGIFAKSARSQRNINNLKQREREITREISELTEAEAERKRQNRLAEEAADAEEEKSQNDFKKSLADKENELQLKKIESMELGFLNAEERLIFHYERRNEIISNSINNELISEERKNALIQSNAESLAKGLGTIREKKRKDDEKSEKAKEDAKVSIFNKGRNALETIGKNSSNKLFKFSQDLALGQAAAALPAAVIEAYKNGGGLPWGAAAAAATFAAGMAQISNIRAARAGAGGSSSAPSSSAASVTPSSPSSPFEDTSPNVEEEVGRGVTLVFNGPISSNDVGKFADDLKEYLDTSDFIMVTKDSMNGLELTA